MRDSSEPDKQPTETKGGNVVCGFQRHAGATGRKMVSLATTCGTWLVVPVWVVVESHAMGFF